jgi:hypothetical protein
MNIFTAVRNPYLQFLRILGIINYYLKGAEAMYTEFVEKPSGPRSLCFHTVPSGPLNKTNCTPLYQTKYMPRAMKKKGERGKAKLEAAKAVVS